MNDPLAIATKQSRRLYVGSLPIGFGLTDMMLLEFFNTTSIALGIQTPQPVLSVWLSPEKPFCFVEYRAITDATYALGLLQGLQLGGRVLKIGRPADYRIPTTEEENYVVGYPPGLKAPTPTIAALAAAANPLVAQQIAMSAQQAGVVGAANVNYNVANAALQTLSSTLPSAVVASPAQPLLIQPSSLNQSSSSIAPLVSTPSSATISDASATLSSSRVLSFDGMVTPSEFQSLEDVDDIADELREECGKFGTIERVIVPCPIKLKPPKENENEQKMNENGSKTSDAGSAVFVESCSGRLFVVYEKGEDAEKARSSFHGRLFAGNPISCNFYDEKKIAQCQYS